MIKIKTPFYDFLEDYRMMYLETREELAQLLHISPYMLSRIENGYKELPYFWFSTLAEHYNLEGSEYLRLCNVFRQMVPASKLHLCDVNWEEVELCNNFISKLPMLTSKQKSLINNVLNDNKLFIY